MNEKRNETLLDVLKEREQELKQEIDSMLKIGKTLRTKLEEIEVKVQQKIGALNELHELIKKDSNRVEKEVNEESRKPSVTDEAVEDTEKASEDR